MPSLLIFAAAAATPLPQSFVVPAPPAQDLAPLCAPTRAEPALHKMPARPDAQRLTELPNANAYLAVLRVDAHGCRRPAIIAYDIGGAPRRAR